MATDTTLGCKLSRSYKESIYSLMISCLDYCNCFLAGPPAFSLHILQATQSHADYLIFL